MKTPLPKCFKAKRLYFLQNGSAGYSGNSPLWWREGGSGYTTKLNEAQKFTLAECRDIIRGDSNHNFVPWPVDKVLPFAHLVIDVQDMK